MKVAVVGLGYWGPNLVRNLYESNVCEQLYCCDTDESKVAKIKSEFRTLAEEIESFKQDNGVYPLSIEPGTMQQFSEGLPRDPFSIEKLPVEYIASASGEKALLVSRGPDLKFQIDLGNVPWEELERPWSPLKYDPTNGTASAGEIYVILPR